MIPNKITNLHNDYQTFKVYDAGEIIDDTTPTLPNPPPPPPRKKKRRWYKKALTALAGVAVAIFAPQALGLVAKGAVTFAGALVGAAAGNIASQVVGNLTGVMDGFNFRSLATDVLTAGLSGGLGGITEGLAEGLDVTSTIGKAIIDGAVRSIGNQGINIITGQQQGFDWRGVAASAISAPLAGAAGKAFGGAETFAGRMASGIVSRGVSVATHGGGRIDYASIAGDAFGNALGNEMAGVGSVSDSERQLQLAEDSRDRAMWDAVGGSKPALADAGQGIRPDGSGGVPSYQEQSAMNLDRMLRGQSPIAFNESSPYELLAGPGAAVPRDQDPYLNYRHLVPNSDRELVDSYNQRIVGPAIARGEDLRPTNENANRLGLISFDEFKAGSVQIVPGEDGTIYIAKDLSHGSSIAKALLEVGEHSATGLAKLDAIEELANARGRNIVLRNDILAAHSVEAALELAGPRARSMQALHGYDSAFKAMKLLGGLAIVAEVGADFAAARPGEKAASVIGTGGGILVGTGVASGSYVAGTALAGVVCLAGLPAIAVGVTVAGAGILAYEFLGPKETVKSTVTTEVLRMERINQNRQTLKGILGR